MCCQFGHQGICWLQIEEVVECLKLFKLPIHLSCAINLHSIHRKKQKKKWRRGVQWHSQQFIADIKIIMIEYILIGIF